MKRLWEIICRFFMREKPVTVPVTVPPSPPLPEPDHTLRLYYECKPFVVTQPWGVYAPELYARFGFTHHNGLDVAHGINRRLRAPFDFFVYRTIWQPMGGGNVLSIISKNLYDSPYGLARVRLDLLHLDKYLKTQGEGVAGDLLALAGTTGYVTGPHTHLKYRWVRQEKNDWIDLEKNDADNSFDPSPFYTGVHAADI